MPRNATNGLVNLKILFANSEASRVCAGHHVSVGLITRNVWQEYWRDAQAASRQIIASRHRATCYVFA